jgi:hypothetical protein
MVRIDRRAPIKVIARELGVSETRINQHIRALKDIYKAENLADLVKSFRAENRTAAASTASEVSKQEQEDTTKTQDLSNPVYSKTQVPGGALVGERGGGNDPGELVMSDVLPMEQQAPWLRPGEPRVVPRVLDGEYAVWFRLLAIIGIAFGFLAAVVLAVTAAVTISDALDGRATVPVDEKGFS